MNPFQKALAGLPPRYVVYQDLGLLRFHIDKGDMYKNTSSPWGRPYVDICYYVTNETHMWEGIARRVKIEDVFPVTPRPFHHLSLFAPRNPVNYLAKEYGDFENFCRSRPFNHVERKKERSVRVPCSQLYRYLPFVNHTHSANAHRETLMIGDHVVYSLET